jgi:hypothetical protein
MIKAYMFNLKQNGLNSEVVLVEDSFNKTVWFMISENYGKYSISIYYDNEYNRANGEGL